MSFFDRLSKGWELGTISLKTISENPVLILFPIISGVTMLFIILSILGGGYLAFDVKYLDNMLAVADSPATEWVLYTLLFVMYLISYTIVIFFNVGLVYAAKKILEGESVTFMQGVRFAMSRFGSIFSWAFIAATIGIILDTLQERLGSAGKIITSIISVVWNIATFFVIPVLAFEDLSPKDAVKKSALIMKEKWGESIGANFSFGIFNFIGILLIVVPSALITGYLIHPAVGVAIGFLGAVFVSSVVSAANMVFLTATYQHINNNPSGHFDGNVLDDIFMPKN